MRCVEEYIDLWGLSMRLMKKKKCLAMSAILLSATLLPACATIKRSDVETLNTGPQISRVLAEGASARTLKRKVAIARFSNETAYAQGFFRDENKDTIGKQAMDVLSAKLAATDKFILLERADLDKIEKELKLGDIAALHIPADYLIVGSVSEFGRRVIGDVGVFSRTKRQEAHAKVNIRLIDVSTGQIIYSAEGAGEAFSEVGTVMGIGGRADYDSTLNDRVLSAAISKMVNNIVENLLDKPWRSYLLSYDSGVYVISGGKSQGIRRNDTFEVVAKGRRVKNPQTGMFIELPGKTIGTIKVVELTGSEPANEVALCAVVAGNIPTDNFENLFVREPDRGLERGE